MDILDALVRLETDLWNAVEHELVRDGHVGLGTLLALRVLDRHDGAGRVQELSDELGVTIGAASKQVDRLERAGVAERRPNPADRRSSLVVLTDAGRAALASAETATRDVLRRLLGDDAELAGSLAAIRRLQGRLAAASAGVG
ncbi:MarR family winged helix-turn-helix transcriptional regulator [Agromyces mangrovi Wang et al. 2018]|uniref:MarR family winged helix-turn-helix transcriptional regulator n=1 Tax=Agromyces mangrovi TaxID=1858653 RepID=UPI002573B76F|nr:MarR family transcriptional regulator [Agromyces mangrovi]BDZ64546.1 hypothetical protein GCM10025877_14840 [Agromyces mangrovi]